VIQGATTPDPEEVALLRHAPHAHTMMVAPPTAWGQTCNIAYPGALLSSLGGLDERLTRCGDDTDLLRRALDAGARQVAAPQALTHHAVQAVALGARLGSLWRWSDVAAVLARHPQMRRELPLGIFWKARHAKLLLALAALAAARRAPALGLAALPWAADALPAYGPRPRGRLRALSELPGQALIDATEIAALGRGSLRHRTLVL
jgi:GT2 family glycosyltransferase